MPLFLARHGERLDYDQLKKGIVWSHTAERPWDPPLTQTGEKQGSLLGGGACQCYHTRVSRRVWGPSMFEAAPMRRSRTRPRGTVNPKISRSLVASGCREPGRSARCIYAKTTINTT